MSEQPPPQEPELPPEPPPEPADEALPAHVIEGARSGRSRCKGCRKAIQKGSLRLGILFEGPYGTGYLWSHLTCAARRRPEDLEAAYAAEAWNAAKVPPEKVPSLEELQAAAAVAEQQSQARREQRRELPYAEVDPSGRARCKQCEKALEKGALRVVLGRTVEFGNQTRLTPINVHMECVTEALEADDCDTKAENFEAQLRANSRGLTTEQLDSAAAAIGEVG